MTETKASCPKCGGHIAFPPELTGQAIACPHCGEVIVLAKNWGSSALILAAIVAIGLVLLGTFLVLYHGKRTKNLEAKQQLSPVELLQSKAAKGDAEAMVQLGELFLSGNGVPTNAAAGEDWYRKAAGLGNRHAMTLLGDMLIEKDSREALKDLDQIKAIISASTNTAIDSSTGLPVLPSDGLTNGFLIATTNAIEAAKWYRKAAELGDTNGMKRFVLTTIGWNTSADPSTGLPLWLPTDDEMSRWTRALAEAGDVEAISLLGEQLTLEKKYSEAVKWDAIAAKSGNAASQFRLARLYDQGLGIALDKEQAVKWYTAAAEQGNLDAQFYLGVKYYFGEGVAKNRTQAFQWCLKAADGPQGFTEKVVDLPNYGRVDLGIVEAQFNVGLMYRDGEGVTKDKQEAFKWFLRAGRHGHGCAQFETGRAYEIGVGVLQDKQEAFKWYQKAAYRGDVMAQRKVGRFYQAAGDSPQNRIAAHKWLSLAAAQGDETASKERDNLAARMNAQESAEASRQAKAVSVGELPFTNDIPFMPVAQKVTANSTRTHRPASGQVTSTDLNGIKQGVARQWPNNYQTQAKQIAAYKELQKLSPGNIPPDVFQRIKIVAAEKWPGDYDMQVYVIGTEMKAYQDLRK